MCAGTGFPVDQAVVVALDVGFDLLKLGVVAHAPDALDAHLGQVVADGQELILGEHEVTGIYCHVGGLVEREAALHEADGGCGKEPDIAKAVHPALGGPQGVVHRAIAAGPQPQAKVHVSALKDVRDFVDDIQPDGKGVIVAHLDFHRVVVAIGKPRVAVPACRDTLAHPQQDDVDAEHQREQRQQRCTHVEQRWPHMSQCQDNNHHHCAIIETNGQKHSEGKKSVSG